MRLSYPPIAQHEQELHIANSRSTKIDKDSILYVGNQRYEKTYANYTLKTGGHFSHTVNGKLDVKAGEHIKEITKLKEMHGSERIVFKSKGGTIIIDGGGITLKGNVTIKGNVAISGGSGGGAESINLSPNKGTYSERFKLTDQTGEALSLEDQTHYRVAGAQEEYVGTLHSSGTSTELNSQAEEDVEFHLILPSAKRKKGE